MADYTEEEIALIRPAFISDGKMGILETLVRTQHENNWNIAVDVEALKAAYGKLECRGVVQLIDVLAREGERELRELGSGSIDFAGVTKGPFSLEAAMSLVALYIGNPKLGITPLQWLTYLSVGFHTMIPIQRKAFSDICENLAAVHDAPHIPLELDGIF